MTTARTEVDCDKEFLDIEIMKMKMELLQFVKKMQSNGLLKSVDYEELTNTLDKMNNYIEIKVTDIRVECCSHLFDYIRIKAVKYE